MVFIYVKDMVLWLIITIKVVMILIKNKKQIMAKYIDKDALVAEIKRRKELVSDPILSGNDLMIGERNAYFNLLSFIGSMQEEPKECMYSKDNYTDEDRKVLCGGCEEECKFNKKEESANDSFEAEVKKLWMEINTGHSYSIVDSYNIFYGLCMDIADWQKQQMMAKAVDTTVHIDAGGYPYIPQMELYDYDKDIPLAKEGDKYKVVLIKKD